MDNRIVINIINFMRNVTLTGEDVPVFVEAMNALKAEINKQDTEETGDA